MNALPWLIVLSLFLSHPPAKAQTAPVNAEAQQLAQTCLACHNPTVSANPLWPQLAGQKKEYLVKAFNDYRSGARKNEFMSPIAKTLNKEEIELVTSYFSSLDPCEKK